MSNQQGEIIALDMQGTQQQRPESPSANSTWHASKYKVHKLHRGYILRILVRRQRNVLCPQKNKRKLQTLKAESNNRCFFFLFFSFFFFSLFFWGVLVFCFFCFFMIHWMNKFWNEIFIRVLGFNVQTSAHRHFITPRERGKETYQKEQQRQSHVSVPFYVDDYTKRQPILVRCVDFRCCL